MLFIDRILSFIYLSFYKIYGLSYVFQPLPILYIITFVMQSIVTNFCHHLGQVGMSLEGF